MAAHWPRFVYQKCRTNQQWIRRQVRNFLERILQTCGDSMKKHAGIAIDAEGRHSDRSNVIGLPYLSGRQSDAVEPERLVAELERNPRDN